MALHRSRARQSLGTSTSRSNAVLYCLLALLFVTAIGGGSSRSDSMSLLYIRPISICALGFGLLATTPQAGLSGRSVYVLLSALTGLIGFQLIPFPHGAMLAGEASSGRNIAEYAPSWRAWTISPDLTLNSLLALAPAWATLVLHSKLSDESRARLVSAALGIVLTSLILGAAQYVAGTDSVLYVYAVSNNEWPIGLLANRNHQAALLSIGLPLMRLWAVSPASGRIDAVRSWLTPIGYVALLTGVLATGSRSGLVLAFIGLVGACFVAPLPKFRPQLTRGKFRLAVGGAILTIGGMTALVLRSSAMERALATPSLDGELRIRSLPTLARMLLDLWPLGSGMGTFNPLYRAYEPDALLTPFYFNHAHNDYIEFVLGGGVPAAILLGIFAGWVCLNGFRVLRSDGGRRSVQRGRFGFVALLIIAVASVTDYPLRTPVFTVLAILFAVWLEIGARWSQMSRLPRN